MNSLRKSTFGFGLAALLAAYSLAACSSEPAKNPGTSNGTGGAGGSGTPCTADTANDPQNCGSCGVACVAGQACVSGVCTRSCVLPQIDCGGLCADPASNALHCGGCNVACASGQICTNSMCVTGSCPGGTLLCSGACVNTQADPLNCGNCGAACLVSQSCQGGICSSSGTGGSGGAGGAGTTGGTAGSGGSGPNGGSGGDAGMAGSGGAPVVLPSLVTSAPNAYWNTTGALTESTANATVTVNDTQAAQTWEGFGGSFNELGWSFLTTQQMKDAAIRLLFSATDGANFVWGRIPMGASDYARTRYTLNDTGTDVVPNGETNRPPADTALAMFSLARDGEMLIPYIKAAQALKPSLRFWASPWTPPVWLKTGYKTNGGSGGNAVRPSYFDGGNMRSDAALLAAYAQYFVKFVEGYKAQGINVEVVAPQNEPGYDQNYPSCLWDATTYTTFIGQHLGPAMMGLGVKVMLGTMSNSGDGGRNDIDIANAVLANTTARGFLSVAGVQWGVLDRVNSGTMLGGLPIWATEHKCGNYPWNPSGSPPYNSTQAPNDQAYAVESWGYLRNAIRNGRVTAYSSWNMVLDRLGLGNDTSRDWRQNALLVADGGQVNPTPTYYVFRHMAQYVAPGAIVVGTSGGDALGFKNPDGSIVAVMFNSGAANNAYVVAIGGRRLSFAMPANGWATVKYRP